MLGYCRMNSRYWNSLSNEERKKITDEWENSQWKINSLDDSKNNIVLGTGYYILLVLTIFFIFIFLAYFIFFITYVTYEVAEFESGPYKIALVFLCIIMSVFAILTGYTKDSSKKLYLEEEKKKRLLKNYNIIK